MLLVYKAVKQQFSPEPSLLEMMRTFQSMVNDCIRMGLDSGKSSYGDVKALCYPRMLEYQIANSYRVSAMFEASNLLKKYDTDSKAGHRPNRPYCRNLFMSASVGVYVKGEELFLPDELGIRLNRHTVSVLAQVEVSSVTITPYNLSVIYRRPVDEMKAQGMVALDLNLENVTTYDTGGRTKVYDIARVAQIHERYRRVTSRFRRNDVRVKRTLFRKLAGLARDRKSWILHNVSSSIVTDAKILKQAIVMENLKGIRGIFRKESKSAASYLSKMNSWPFAELQRQVEHKAKWEGLPVIRVEPEGTSSTCSSCGGALKESPEEHPIQTCPSCGLVIDRDLNAAKNILSRALRFGDVGPAGEAMVGRGS